MFDTDKALEKVSRDKLGITRQYDSLDEILKDDMVGAVHLVTPIPLHEEQSIAVLEAGKHCVCTAPVATTLEGIRKITQAKQRSGKIYMFTVGGNITAGEYRRDAPCARRIRRGPCLPFSAGCVRISGKRRWEHGRYTMARRRRRSA